MTALTSICSSTSAADFSQDPLEGWREKGRVAVGKDDSETGKKKQSRKTRCENVVTETKVNKRT